MSKVIIETIPLTAEEEAERESITAKAIAEEQAAVVEAKRLAYQRESDPLFFKWQAGEVTEQEWLDARAAVSQNVSNS